MKRGVQKFTKEYLEHCKQMTPMQILEFIDSFQKLMYSQKSKTKLISLKVEEDLLENFKKTCQLNGIKYQTQIKKLLREWLLEQN
jgi:predicted DNA binding CopG/RHH family protein